MRGERLRGFGQRFRFSGSASPFVVVVCWAVTHPPPALEGGGTGVRRRGKAARKRAAQKAKPHLFCAQGAVILYVRSPPEQTTGAHNTGRLVGMSGDEPSALPYL